MKTEEWEELSELAVPEFHPKYLPPSMCGESADEGPTLPDLDVLLRTLRETVEECSLTNLW